MLLSRFQLILLFGLLLPACSHSSSKNKPSTAGQAIEITTPQPHANITSPLTIKGKAKGGWYFEGSFLIELVDTNGNKLAEGPAKAHGQWMTDTFVPFSLTLQFDPPGDQRGRLIFHRANPSGKPENDMQYALPVIFAP